VPFLQIQLPAFWTDFWNFCCLTQRGFIIPQKMALNKFLNIHASPSTKIMVIPLDNFMWAYLNVGLGPGQLWANPGS